MARRRQSGLEAIASLPWPVGVALGLVGFWAVRYGLGGYVAQRGEALGAVFAAQAAGGALAPLAWMVLLLCWIAALASFFAARKRAYLLQTSGDIAGIASLGWREFEQLVGEAFRRQGFSVDETGQGGADGGVDLVLRKAGGTTLVQCKRWRQRQVPVSTVREMWGLRAHHDANAVMIVCVGDYTPDARRFAAGKAIELVTGTALVDMVKAVRQNASAPDVPRERIEPVLTPSTTARSVPIACPRCSSPMARRTNRQTGTTFWGCTDYPRCRGTRAEHLDSR